MILKHPITGREIRVEVAEWLPGCAYFRCERTGLQWLDPQPACGPVYPDFSAYADELLGAATPEQIKALLAPSEQAALDWVRGNLGPGAKIVELFAEVGRFAWQLRSDGYQVRLADPLASHVSVLCRHDFTAVQTANPAELPANWSDADAVVILESIIRVARPAVFMAAVRARFPQACVFVTAPSLRRPLKLPGVDRRAGYPPDFLTRWTVPALRELLATSGYSAHGRGITPRTLATLRGRRWRGQIFVMFQILLMRASGEYEFSVSGWGRPRNSRRENAG
jgi:hypothetical protein